MKSKINVVNNGVLSVDDTGNIRIMTNYPRSKTFYFGLFSQAFLLLFLFLQNIKSAIFNNNLLSWIVICLVIVGLILMLFILAESIKKEIMEISKDHLKIGKVVITYSDIEKLTINKEYFEIHKKSGYKLNRIKRFSIADCKKYDYVKDKLINICKEYEIKTYIPN